MFRPMFSAIRVAVLVLLATACSSLPPATDAGTDAPITFEPLDGGPPDAGPPDAGEPDGAADWLCADLSMVPLGTLALPPECLPVCTAATRDAVEACGDAACVDAAIAADASPPVRFLTRFGVYSVSCREMRTFPCRLWQTFSCFEEYCRGEYYTYADCVDGGGTCETELGVVEACMAANADATACLAARTRACFPD